MGDPTNTNQTATEINTVIANANSVGVQVVQTLIIASVPWLGSPILKQLLGWLLGWLDGYIAKAEEQGATFGVIDVQVGSEKSGLSTALQNLIAAEKSGDANAIQKTIQAYQAAQSSLIHSDGSASL